MTQVLHLLNGKTIQEKLESKDGRVAKFLETNIPNNELIDIVYLSAITRYPNETERQQLSAVLDEAVGDDKRAAIEDLYWSVLTSKEFLFQH